ncbi:MAG: hypothetical protein B7Y93_09450 [Micrococcales bacterium 32-70-13]|nr:MAG: hypothetical protein B7Y93_09450 [Micrococcales bacterium 32-70-13]
MDMEVVSEAVPFRPSKRHHFTAAQKWALLLEWDQCLDRGAKTAFCRRIGVWTGTPWEWARQRADGRLQDPATVESMSEEPKGYTPRLNFEERQELARLRREKQRLERELEQSQAAVDILGKAAALLESLAKSAEQPPTTEPEPTPGRPAWLQGPDTSQLPPIPPRPSKPRE